MFHMFLFLLIILPAAAAPVARAVLVKGTVTQNSSGVESALVQGAELNEGAIVRTSEKSVVKLVFIDSSQMIVAPKSEIKVERFTGKDAGIIDLVKGQIRSKVSKDYLQQQDQQRSKLFIKTQTAAMGVRGTDFLVTVTQENTAVVLFEGEVAFNQRSPNNDPADLDELVDRGVRIAPGEFSTAGRDSVAPTVPAVLNVKQLERLEDNENFQGDRAPASTADEGKRSVVPPGLSGETVASAAPALQGEFSAATVEVTGASTEARGFVEDGKVRPANGSFLHLDTGTVVPPASDAVFDPISNSFIPAPGDGTISVGGDFVPPKNITITAQGNILVSVTNASGQNVSVELPKLRPVLSADAPSLKDVATMASQNPSGLNTIATPPALDLSNLSRPLPPLTGGIDQTTSIFQKTEVRVNISMKQ